MNNKKERGIENTEEQYQTTLKDESDRTNSHDITPNKAALIAGVAYFIIIVGGIFGFFVRSSLIVNDSANLTAENISNSEILFRMTIIGDFLVFTSDIIVSVMLYLLFKKDNQSLSLLAAIFRLVQTTISGINLINLSIVLIILNGSDTMVGFESNQSNTLILMFLKAHTYGLNISLMFFGIHCLLLSFLIFKSIKFPKLLGVLLFFASFGYLVNSISFFLLKDYQDFETIFTVIVFIPALIAEISLASYLFYSGALKKHLN